MEEPRRKEYNWRTFHALLVRYNGDFRNVPSGLLENITYLNRDGAELASTMGEIAYHQYTEWREERVVVTIGNMELKKLALEKLKRGRNAALP